MSTWKPVAIFLLVSSLLAILALFGVNHHAEIPNALGWGILAILVVGAFRLDL